MAKTAVFEAESTVKKWDDDYYTPISVQLYDRAVNDMLADMNVPAGATVLDAGCGPGVHSIRVAKAGCNVRAIDISSTMLAHAKQRVEEAGLADKVIFEQQDLTKLQMNDKSVDYAFFWGVIIHIPDAEKAFRELARVIKPGGKLALYLTNGTAMDHKLERVARSVTGKKLKSAKTPLGEHTFYQMESEELCVWQFDAVGIQTLFESMGFKLVSRRAGEFSEIQRRVKGPVRNALLRANNLAYAMKAPASWAVSNLTIFERKHDS